MAILKFKEKIIIIFGKRSGKIRTWGLNMKIFEKEKRIRHELRGKLMSFFLEKVK